MEDATKKHFKGNSSFTDDFTSMMQKSIRKKPIIQMKKEKFIEKNNKRKEEQLKKKVNEKHKGTSEVIIVDYNRSM